MYFVIEGPIADVDSTTAPDAYHPALVLVVDAAGELEQVVIPNALLNGDLARFSVGARVTIHGYQVEDAALGAIPRIAHSVSIEPQFD